MKDWINPELLENKYDNRRKIFMFPQGKLFTVSESDSKEFRRFAYAVRGLVEAVEVTGSGQIIQKANDWVNKILELDRQEVVRESTPAEQGQPAGSLLQNSEDNIIGIAGQVNSDRTVEVITTGAAQVNVDNSILQVIGTGDRTGINWNDIAASGDISIGNWMFPPSLQLNLYEIVVKFLRTNGRWVIFDREYLAGQNVISDTDKITIPADLAVLSIEYDFNNQQVNFLVWSQYFEKNMDGAIPMVHELMFADLKSIKPVISEDGMKLRKLMIEETYEQNI